MRKAVKTLFTTMVVLFRNNTKERINSLFSFERKYIGHYRPNKLLPLAAKLYVVVSMLSITHLHAIGKLYNIPISRLEESIKAVSPIKGKIVDAKGQPMEGVNIIVSGSKSGISTLADGSFSIEVKEQDQIEISSVGYVPLVIQLKNGVYIAVPDPEQTVKSKVLNGKPGNLRIQLVENPSSLDEVVVIGYGQVKKRDLTGAVSSVNVEENVKRQFSTVDELLQGRAAGVQVNSNDGNPGAGISVRIRGVSTLSRNTEPLYVVDGIIINSANEDVQKTVNESIEY